MHYGVSKSGGGLVKMIDAKRVEHQWNFLTVTSLVVAARLVEDVEWERVVKFVHEHRGVLGSACSQRTRRTTEEEVSGHVGESRFGVGALGCRVCLVHSMTMGAECEIDTGGVLGGTDVTLPAADKQDSVASICTEQQRDLVVLARLDCLEGLERKLIVLKNGGSEGKQTRQRVPLHDDLEDSWDLAFHSFLCVQNLCGVLGAHAGHIGLETVATPQFLGEHAAILQGLFAVFVRVAVWSRLQDGVVEEPSCSRRGEMEPNRHRSGRLPEDCHFGRVPLE
mmetsp:Transcript_29564/g.63875  ORF Transcript_29564/g.63875 Transcript_29564/m.63875 type:complete len:280 (-) Transcript_29564:386-1225(-)